jgi:hypothetical protein
MKKMLMKQCIQKCPKLTVQEAPFFVVEENNISIRM